MFKTLDDLKKDTKTKKVTNSYTGGEKSGLAVENNDANEIMTKASKKKQSDIPGEEDEKSANSKTNCVIKLYQNCFQIQDGPLCDYSAEENKQFMKELNEGHVPKELQGKYPQGLYVGVEDHRDEICELPAPPKYTAFSGQGQALTQNQAKQQNYQNRQVNGMQQQQVQVMPVNLKATTFIKCNESMPYTTICIQLHNNEQTQVKLNTFAKVQELYDYINTQKQLYQHFELRIAPIKQGKFQILSGFPPQPILNLNQTIEQADLLDAKVRQKL